MRRMGWSLSQWEALPERDKMWHRADDRRILKRVREIQKYKWIVSEENTVGDPSALLTLLLETI